MKKTRLFLITLLIFSTAVINAEEVKKGLSTGGMVVLETNNTGGSAEFGFTLYEGKKVEIRNYIMISGFGYDGGGTLALGEKMTFGGLTARGMRPYSFIEGHVGLYKTAGKEFTELPLYFDLKGGGGMDIYGTSNMSLFVEAGGGVSFHGEHVTGLAHLAVGFRTFWN